MDGDIAKNAHKSFSAECFNTVWDLLDKPDQTEAETETMLHAAHASLWHWMQREDVTDQNLSIGYWQLSRIYAVAGIGEQALVFGKRSLDTGSAEGIDAFFPAYAYEAIARAYAILSASENARKAVFAARELMKQSKEDDLTMLENDLAEVEKLIEA